MTNEEKMEFVRAFAALILVLTALVVGIAVMICGWGLTPQSWWWIIGGSFVAGTLTTTARALAKK